MIDKLEIQSGLAKRILNTLPYLHTPEAIAQELDKTEVMRNIVQTSRTNRHHYQDQGQTDASEGHPGYSKPGNRNCRYWMTLNYLN